MPGTYKITVAGQTRELPLCPAGPNLDIAAFIMFGDVPMTEACGKALAEKAPPCDIIITAESKGIPLAYEMARLMNMSYIVARKGRKLYMKEPFVVDVRSITTEGEQILVLDGHEAELMKGRRVLIVDDVVSTGESLAAVEKLVSMAGGRIVGKCAVLAEGDAIGREDVFYLEELPVFPK